jgi:DNA gyrase subunit A
MKLLEVDELQANAILDMQLRRIAALERQKIIDENDELMKEIKELKVILESPEKQRLIIKNELTEVGAKYGNERRTQIIAGDTDLSVEDLIPDQDVVVTITKGGYSKRTKADAYRAQKRGGKGVKGAALKTDDVVEHFFTASTHNWLLFFTNKGRVYRAKVHELPDAGRDARGQHVANLLAFKPDETIAQVIAIADYQTQPYLVIATKAGIVKKTPLLEYDSPRSGGLIAVSLKATGVIGMKFRKGDNLLAMAAISSDNKNYVFTATDGGYAKRTKLEEYRSQGRGGIGVKAAKIDEDSRGVLVGAMIVQDSDEILAISSAGTVMRTPLTQIRETGRDTLGVRLVNLDAGISVVSVTRLVDDLD